MLLSPFYVASIGLLMIEFPLLFKSVEKGLDRFYEVVKPLLVLCQVVKHGAFSFLSG